MTDRPDTKPDLAAELGAQGPFLRRLAGALIGNEHDAEDAVQEAMVAAWRSDDRPRSGPRLRAWLATVLRRGAVSHLRWRGVRGEVPLELEPAAAEGAAPDAVAMRLERQLLLQGATLSLPGRYREVVVLRFQDGLPPAEIARMLGVSVDTVNTRLQRGIVRLRQELDRRGRSAGEADPRRAWIASLMPLALPRGLLPEGEVTSDGEVSELTDMVGVRAPAAVPASRGTPVPGAVVAAAAAPRIEGAVWLSNGLAVGGVRIEVRGGFTGARRDRDRSRDPGGAPRLCPGGGESSPGESACDAREEW